MDVGTTVWDRWRDEPVVVMVRIRGMRTGAAAQEALVHFAEVLCKSQIRL
jgi:hypothetical protein